MPYSAEQMFTLVNDIASYPKFMPGCEASEVLCQGEGWLEARLDLNRMGIKQSFATRNQLSPPNLISLTLLNGPFRSLTGEWRFSNLGESGCKIVFWLEFDVLNKLMALALPTLMKQVATEQVDCICKRARTVYG